MATKHKDTFLQIAELGNPAIRKKAAKLTNVKSKKTQDLIDSLIATLIDFDGAGIAAPQVCKSTQLVIVASHPSPEHPDAPKMKPTAVINPKILEFSKKKVKDWEGCLSVPGIRGLVSRSKKIKIEYTTRDGKKVIKEYKDFIARVFQHECDHLNGIVFLDRVKSTKEVISEREHKKLLKRKKKAKKSSRK